MATKIPKTLNDTIPEEYRAEPTRELTIAKGGQKAYYALTPDDEKLFWGYFEQWRDRLNLRDWWLSYKTSHKKNHLAWIDSISHVQRTAAVTLSTHWGMSEPTPEELERTAIHEALHLTLLPLSRLLQERGVDEDKILEAEHACINPLVEALLTGSQLARR